MRRQGRGSEQDGLRLETGCGGIRLEGLEQHLPAADTQRGELTTEPPERGGSEQHGEEKHQAHTPPRLKAPFWSSLLAVTQQFFSCMKSLTFGWVRGHRS